LHGSARYMLANDDFIPTDLKWAGYAFDKKTTNGFRFRKARRLRSFA
jgi:hypothetical protein